MDFCSFRNYANTGFFDSLALEHTIAQGQGAKLSWWLDLLSCSGLEGQLERAASILSAGSEAGWQESGDVSNKTCLGSSTRSSKLKQLT